MKCKLVTSVSSVFVTLLSYEMMMRCWEKRPVDRPTFQNLNRDISAYVEQLADYLELEFSPI